MLKKQLDVIQDEVDKHDPRVQLEVSKKYGGPMVTQKQFDSYSEIEQMILTDYKLDKTKKELNIANRQKEITVGPDTGYIFYNKPDPTDMIIHAKDRKRREAKEIVLSR